LGKKWVGKSARQPEANSFISAENEQMIEWRYAPAPHAPAAFIQFWLALEK
jgi:hypothetical protein